MNTYPDWFYPYTKRSSILSGPMREMLKILQKYKNFFDFGLEVPLSFISKTKSRSELDNKYLHNSWKNTQEIPLVIFSKFPHGKPLLTIFDENFGELFVLQHLKEIGIPTMVVNKIDHIDIDAIFEEISKIEENESDSTEIIGFEHSVALGKFRSLTENQNCIIFNEFRLSKVSEFIRLSSDDHPPLDDSLQKYAQSASLDMLLVDLSNGEPLLAIEYDGSGHWGKRNESDETKAKQRDRKKNEYCIRIGLPILRIKIDSLFIGRNSAKNSNYEIQQLYVWEFLRNSIGLILDFNKHKNLNVKINSQINSILPNLSEIGFSDEYNYKKLLEMYADIYQANPEILIEKNFNKSWSGTIKINDSDKIINITSPIGLSVKLYGLPYELGIRDFTIHYISSYLLMLAIRRKKHDFIATDFDWFRYVGNT